MQSSETADIYRTAEPQTHFDSRIRYGRIQLAIGFRVTIVVLIEYWKSQVGLLSIRFSAHIIVADSILNVIHSQVIRPSASNNFFFVFETVGSENACSRDTVLDHRFDY